MAYQNKGLYNSERDLIDDPETRYVFREKYTDELGIEPNDEELTDYMLDFFNIDEVKTETPNNPNDAPFNKILGLFFIIWFMASLIGIVVFLEKNPNIGYIIFGQYFLVFGLIALFNKVAVGWIFSVVGLGFIVVPIWIRNPEIIPFSVNWEFWGVFIFGLVFFIAGIALNIVKRNSNQKLKDRCTTRVDATIVSIKDKYYPIYEYTFYDKKHRIKGIYTEDCSVGRNVQLLINPGKPREAYFYDKKYYLFIFCFSLVFIASGIFVMVVSIMNYL